MTIIAAIISLIIAIIIFAIGFRVLKGIGVLKKDREIHTGEILGIIIIIATIIMIVVFQYDPDEYPDVVNIKMFRK